MSTGTVPFNFPPESVLPIGGIIGASSLGNTSALPRTNFFTAPTSGVYGVSTSGHIVSTDGAGTITVTLNLPYANSQNTTKPVTIDTNQAAVAWLNRGDTISISTATTGIVATVYDVYLCARRLF